MSYWFDPVELYPQAASYIDRILKGANPADLGRLRSLANLQSAARSALMVDRSP
jgi:hypothetical protein